MKYAVYKNWFRHSKVNRERIHRHTDRTEIAFKSEANASELLRYAYINFLIPYLLFTA
jgi:hypothetical protein